MLLNIPSGPFHKDFVLLASETGSISANQSFFARFLIGIPPEFHLIAISTRESIVSELVFQSRILRFREYVFNAPEEIRRATVLDHRATAIRALATIAKPRRKAVFTPAVHEIISQAHVKSHSL